MEKAHIAFGKVSLKGQKDKKRPTKQCIEIKDRTTRTPLKTWDELMCSGRVISFRSTCGTRRVTNSVIIYE
jgi:hypothetical protein